MCGARGALCIPPYYRRSARGCRTLLKEFAVLIEARSLAFHRADIARIAERHYFACRALFSLLPFFELTAALTAPMTAGATDTATMPKTMTSK